MVENELCGMLRARMKVEGLFWRAIGLRDLLVMPARNRRVREAVAQRLRLKPDMIELASVVPDSLDVVPKEGGCRTARFWELKMLLKSLEAEVGVVLGLPKFRRMGFTPLPTEGSAKRADWSR